MRPAFLLTISTALVYFLAPSSAPGQEPATAPKLVAESGPRTPEEERSGFRLPEGFVIELVASEPQINKPMNLAFDDRGRLWVTSTLEYPYPAKDGSAPRDRVVILSDFAEDGRARSATTFADGLNIPIGVLPIGRGDSALVHAIPSIRRLTDTDGDGKADKTEVAYDRFGFKDTHGMTNAFTWGLDGWIYACHGFSNDSKVEGADKKPIVMQSGNIYRMKADGSHAEYYSHGQVNPFGLAFDPTGNLYSCDCHSRPIYQNLRGAYYPSFGKPDDGLGFGPEMIGHDHGSTGIGGIAYYAADHFPPAFRDNIFIGNVVTSRINRDHLDHSGSSPRAVAEPDFVESDDPWFRPVDIELGPDGALYVADFYNRIIGHYEVPLEHPGRDRERGRIWRISYKGKDGANRPRSPRADFSTATVAELVEDLGHPNLTVRTKATNQLVDRGPAAIEAVKAAVGSDAVGLRKAHGLWVLHRLGALDDATLASAARDAVEAVRVHAFRILADRPRLGAEGKALALLAIEGDAPAEVRRAAVEVLDRHPTPDQIRPLVTLAAFLGQVAPTPDTHLRHVTRMALRDQLGDGPAWAKVAALNLGPAEQKALADVAPGVPSEGSARFLLAYLPGHPEPLAQRARFVRHVARHGGAGAEPALVAFARRGEFSAPARVALVKAIQQGTQERGGSVGPDTIALAGEVARTLIASEKENEIKAGIELVGLFKLSAVGETLASILADRAGPAARRSQAMTALVALDPEGTLASLGRLVRDPSESADVREPAASLLAASGKPEARAALVEALATAPARLQAAIAAGLAQGRPGAEALLAAVAAGKASARPLQERGVAVRLAASGVPDIKGRLESLLKDLPPADRRVLETIDRRRAGFLAAGGDASKGATVFEKTCAACHQLEGRGARVGPQLDGVGSRGVDRLLEDTLDPNRNVDQAFRTTTLGLADGRIVAGLLLRQDGEVLVLADAKGQEVRVPAATVEDRKQSQLSPMPANIAEELDDADFRNLMAYLLAQKPVARP